VILKAVNSDGDRQHQKPNQRTVTPSCSHLLSRDYASPYNNPATDSCDVIQIAAKRRLWLKQAHYMVAAVATWGGWQERG